jgi:hypothetical protein
LLCRCVGAAAASGRSQAARAARSRRGDKPCCHLGFRLLHG